MGKTKTLTQLLQEKYPNWDIENLDFTYTEIKEAVKAWLTQKRLLKFQMNFPSNDVDAINYFIDELLEELNQQ